MSQWILRYDDFEPEQERFREALCTLGNGYFATRGALESARADAIHYPATYLAGGYNRLRSEIAGEILENEDLVNFPNWLCLTFRLEGSEWFGLKSAQVISYSQELNLKEGVLHRRFRVRDEQGRETTVASRRFVHMHEPHIAAMEIRYTAENWSGPMQIRSALDGRVANTGVKRYRQLASSHLDYLSGGTLGEDGVFLTVQTNQSHIQLAEAARTRIFRSGMPTGLERKFQELVGFVAQDINLNIVKGESVSVEKIFALYTSRDRGISECGLEAVETIDRAGSFEDLLKTHALAWERLWSQCDMKLDKDDQPTQLLLRFHIFHLFQTVSPNSVDLDIGVPPRGWHGEAYRGHIMWDDLFAFSFSICKFQN